MSADDFQQLLKQLDHRIAGIDAQKKTFSELSQKVDALERLSETDPAARQTLQALHQYQQSERFVTLRDKALQEIAVLQQQYAQLQHASSPPAPSVAHNNAVRIAASPAAPAVKLKRRLYI